MNTCTQCKAQYEAQRASSLYCSAKCRVAHKRGVSVTDSVTKVSVTPVSVTDNGTTHTPEGYLITGYSKGNGNPARNGIPMVYCGTHQEHITAPYCKDMCDNCVHIE